MINENLFNGSLRSLCCSGEQGMHALFSKSKNENFSYSDCSQLLAAPTC